MNMKQRTKFNAKSLTECKQMNTVIYATRNT